MRLCVFCVFYCVQGALNMASRAPQQSKNGARDDFEDGHEATKDPSKESSRSQQRSVMGPAPPSMAPEYSKASVSGPCKFFVMKRRDYRTRIACCTLSSWSLLSCTHLVHNRLWLEETESPSRTYQGKLHLAKGTCQESDFGRSQSPPPLHSALLRKWPVLRRAMFVLTQDPWPLCYKTPPCQFHHKLPSVRPFWVLSKVEIGPL